MPHQRQTASKTKVVNHFEPNGQIIYTPILCIIQNDLIRSTYLDDLHSYSILFQTFWPSWSRLGGPYRVDLPAKNPVTPKRFIYYQLVIKHPASWKNKMCLNPNMLYIYGYI